MRIALLLLALLLAACGGDAPKANINIGSNAPAFKTVRADASAAGFPADFAGKPVVIRFWADWCKYCKEFSQGGWEDLRKAVESRPEIELQSVDVDSAAPTDKAAVASADVQAMPDIRLVLVGKRSIKYEGERSATAILAALDSLQKDGSAAPAEGVAHADVDGQ